MILHLYLSVVLNDKYQTDKYEKHSKEICHTNPTLSDSDQSCNNVQNVQTYLYYCARRSILNKLADIGPYCKNIVKITKNGCGANVACSIK